MAAFHAREIDYCEEQSAADARAYEHIPGVRVETVTTPFVQQLTLNVADPIFADPAVRRAIAHALDRPSMVRAVVGSDAYVARSIVGPVHWSYSADVPSYAYEPERAERLQPAASRRRGADGVRVRGTQRLAFVNHAWREWERSYATLIVQYLRRIGVEMTVRVAPDFASIEAVRRTGTAQSLYFGSFDYEPSELYQYFHGSQSPPAGVNLGHYGNPVVDDLLVRAQVTTGLADRKALYAEVQSRILDDCATIPLHVHMVSCVIGPRLGGYPPPKGNWQAVIHDRPWLLTTTS